MKIIEQGKSARKHPQYHHIKANLPVNQWLGSIMDKSSQKLKVSSSHLQAIGKVASEWSALEFSFQCAMGMVSKVPVETVVAFTAPSPMYVWIDILENLLQLEPPNAELTKQLRALFKRIRKAQKDRNTIVHAVWSQQFASDLGKDRLDECDKAYGVGFPKKIKNGLINQFSYTTAEMHTVANEIRQLADEFRSVFWPKTKPDK